MIKISRDRIKWKLKNIIKIFNIKDEQECQKLLKVPFDKDGEQFNMK